MEFALCYIKNDDIPELVVGAAYEYATQNTKSSVYTYRNGKVSFICEVGEYGNIPLYEEYENKICKIDWGTEVNHYLVCGIKDGKYVCIWEGYYYYPDYDTGKEAVYISNGVEVTREEFFDAESKYYSTKKYMLSAIC